MMEMEALMVMSDKIYGVLLKNIRVSKLNARVTDAKVGIDELAKSIEKYGLLQPVVLKGEFGKPPYELVVGQRRFLAHKKLEMKKIRAIFCKEENELKLRMLSLSENMHRAELNYADKAEAITLLYQELGRSANKVAKELSLSVATIIEYVRLEEQATSKAKELLKKRRIKKADVKRAISAAQGDKGKIDLLLDALPKLTKYEKDRAVEYGKKEKVSVKEIISEAKKPKLKRTIILNLDDEMNDALNKAGEKMYMDREEIAALALEDWLEENGFLKKTGKVVSKRK